MVLVTKLASYNRAVAIICDRCQKRIEANSPDFDAVTHIDHHCGYNSPWEDGSRISADICESCLQELISDFCNVHKNQVQDTASIDPDEVFRQLDEMRESGELTKKISNGRLCYQASTAHPGLLEQVEPNGNIKIGNFLNGQFVEIDHDS